MEPFPGTITVEYYDGNSDFSDTDVSEDPYIDDQSSSCSSPYSTSSAQLEHRDAVSWKTYDFKHVGSESEYTDGGDIKPVKQKICSDVAKEAMSNHYEITHQEYLDSLMHPKASFPRCPRGDVPEQYGRRKHPGPFLTCSLGHSHECGDDFTKIPISTKPSPEFDTFTRPQHLKEKKAKFFKQCKHCESIAFTHHRNPARHYEDYLNNVTYKQHGDHTKVWQQHLVDYLFTLDEDAATFSGDETILEKCQHYKPSEAVVKSATKTCRSSRRRVSAVITRKRVAIPRPSFRRPLPKANNDTTTSSNGNSARVDPEQQSSEIPEANHKKFSSDNSHHSRHVIEPTVARNAKSTKMPEKMQLLHQQRRDRRSPSSDINIDGRKTNDLHSRLKESVTRLINSRQTRSKASMRFVKKPEPPKEVKYIQKGKPNISAKFLRARSRSNKGLKSSMNAQSPHLASPRSSGRGKSSSVHAVRKSRTTQAKSSGKSAAEKSRMQRKNNLKDDSSDDGSYAQYRDQNGEFDVEKYRQSILKMLSKNLGKGSNEKKKKQKHLPKTSQASFVTLPKIKNAYRDVKPRVTSNILQRKRRKMRKLKRDSDLDFQVPSDVSLSSKYWNDDSSRDSYFSVPSV